MFWKLSGKHVINYTTSKSRKMKAEKQPLELVTWRILVMLTAVWEKNENYWGKRGDFMFSLFTFFLCWSQATSFSFTGDFRQDTLLLWALIWRWGTWYKVISQNPSSSQQGWPRHSYIWIQIISVSISAFRLLGQNLEGQGWITTSPFQEAWDPLKPKNWSFVLINMFNLMGEDICKQCYWHGINFQNIQTSQTVQ